jgi:hypothetical protein
MKKHSSTRLGLSSRGVSIAGRIILVSNSHQLVLKHHYPVSKLAQDQLKSFILPFINDR